MALTRTKRVNIQANIPVRNITPPIHGSLHNVVMSTGDILKCISRHAKVEEILPDGTTVKLNFSNYYTDNGAGLYSGQDIKEEKPAINNKVPKMIKTEVDHLDGKEETDVDPDEEKTVDKIYVDSNNDLNGKEETEEDNTTEEETITKLMLDDHISLEDQIDLLSNEDTNKYPQKKKNKKFNRK